MILAPNIITRTQQCFNILITESENKPQAILLTTRTDILVQNNKKKKKKKKKDMHYNLHIIKSLKTNPKYSNELPCGLCFQFNLRGGAYPLATHGRCH